MGINRKIGAAITATMLLALNVSSPPPATAFSCRANSRGIGNVSAASDKHSVALYWSSPGYWFQMIHVCYKKSWSLEGKCEGGRDYYETFGSPASQGQILIRGLEKNSCYKFAVYGVDAGDRLIGIAKIKTTKK